jgi:hypothetical protein
MSGHRPFVHLTKDFTLERRTRIALKAAALRGSPPEGLHDVQEQRSPDERSDIRDGRR